MNATIDHVAVRQQFQDDLRRIQAAIAAAFATEDGEALTARLAELADLAGYYRALTPPIDPTEGEC